LKSPDVGAAATSNSGVAGLPLVSSMRRSQSVQSPPSDQKNPPLHVDLPDSSRSFDRSKSVESRRGSIIDKHRSDSNPIPPCGACYEWLKKIAEVNPDFKVVTFTSAQCDAIFVKPVGQ